MNLKSFACVSLVAVAEALYATDGTVLADSPTSATFSVHAVDEEPLSASSAAELAAFPHVAWLAGETVTATSSRGETSTLVSDAASAGDAAFPPVGSGGVWTLVNSSHGTVRIGIPWSVYGDSGQLASGVSGAYVVDALQDGPDRKIRRKDTPPVAYSGDEWIGAASKTATLTLAPSAGEATVLALDGTGATPFKFTADEWTVTLAADGYPTRTAYLNVTSGGFFLVVK